MSLNPFVYHNIKSIRVVDGDTVELELDAGFRLTYKDLFRLARINAPEPNQVGGPEASKRLTELLAGGIFKVETKRRDKYGRWVIEIYIPTSGGTLNVSDVMLNEGFAILYK